MRLKTLSIAVLSVAFMASCGSQKKEEKVAEPERAKTLVLYYSQTGATKTVAEELRKQLGAHIDSIIAESPYNEDYDATVKRWIQEKEDSVKVGIKPLTVNVNDYDTIFLGFPIWGGTIATPVDTYLTENDLSGKTIITFATYGSGGLELATINVAADQPNAVVEEGFGIRNARIAKAPAEIKRFLVEQGHIEGIVSKMPEFGESAPVTDEEKAIFNQACGDYKFPLGNPVSVAMRQYDETREYKYDVVSQGPEGTEKNSTIYVLLEPGTAPEFTKVVR